MNKLFILVAFVTILSACSESDSVTQTLALTPQSLVEHSKTFRKSVVNVTDGVYVAVGYGLANSIMLEGDDGLVIVDTMESVEEAEQVLKAFREISNKPIKAIIYTHNHTDHVFGSSVFADSSAVEVYAHSSTQHFIDRLVNVTRPIIQKRSTRMFGSRLTDSELVNAGIGPHLSLDDDSHVNAMKPTITFEQSLKVTIAGIDIELYHAPGETEDQLLVWLPQKKVLLPGDNIYKTFPNLYTIRGTHYRDVKQWIASLDLMRTFNADYLVPSHTRPVVGEANVADVLTHYRDAIAFVHDQTLRGMNLDMTVEQIVEQVQLPEHLSSHPYLQEFYGTVEWSVRAIFSGYMGWFDGNSTHLFPLRLSERAQRLSALAGGFENLLRTAEDALSAGDYQWVLELADLLITHSETEKAAQSLKIKALRALAGQQANPNARHYYFTQALEIEQQSVVAINPQPTPEYLNNLALGGIFETMAVSLKAEKTLDMNMSVNFIFPDTHEVYVIIIRRGIVEIKREPVADADLELSMPSLVWKSIVSRQSSPLSHFASGDISITGSKLELVEFLRLFESF